ncbi:MAG TPA: alpha/beta hydrolase [Anaerolineales bacterium]|nr:alpha/beta hydrolase [Anaerolineales bacterium]
MSSITTDQGIVHYEVYGRGRPVILLHGWLGSWGLWQDTMSFLGQYYRTYALDFWGFGESGKKRETYAVQDFVSLVDQFMEQLGIVNAPLVGHSMGGTVSLSVAIKYPQRVSKVVIVGSPIVGSSLALPLKFAGYRPIAFMLFNMMGAFRLAMRIASPIICHDERFPEMMDRDLSRTTLESFLLSIASLRRTDLRPMLGQVKVPAMGMFGDRDVIVHPRQWEPMKKGIDHAQIERFPSAGHFIMLDEPQDFKQRLKTFLDVKEPVPAPQQISTTLSPTPSVTL